MQASARVVETIDVPTSGAAPAQAAAPVRSTPRRRLSQRAIEVIGVVIGIALIAVVARAHDLSNDVFWSLAAGQWMLAHHAFMGLDPFSYTEAHHRWVTDEWGSEIALATLFRVFGNAAYSGVRRRPGWAVPRDQRGLRPGLGRAGWADRRHRHPPGHRHRGHRGGRPRARLLPGVAPAGALAPDQGAGQSALAVPPAAALPPVGQHPRLHPARPLRARRRARLVADPGAVRAQDRRRATSRLTPGPSGWHCWGA